MTGTLNIAPASGYGNIEMGGPSGGYIDFKAPFGDDYDGRIIYNGSNFTVATGLNQPVVLQHNNSTKLATTTSGIDVTGTVEADAMTVNGNTVWNAGNDGSGSGLDADTVDGLHGTDIVETSNGTSNDLDTNLSAQMFGFSTGTSNRPQNYGQGLTIVSSGKTQNNTNNWATQIAFGTDENSMYFRGKTNAGSWNSWRTVWHSGNDGAGSGLDADTLDGYTWESVGKNLRGTEIYADNWFRNNGSGEGIYNQVTGQHFYSDDDDYWNIAGGTAANGLRFRDEYAGTVRGYVYATASNEIGFLNSGGSWSFKCDNSGNVTATGNVTAYSDERLKSDIETLDGSKVYEMRGVSFTKDGEASSGVIAQELQKVAPELVDDSGEYLSVAYGNLVGYLIEAVKELKAEVEQLKSEK
jgi:hypothetical protein